VVDLKPAAELDAAALAELFSAGYEGYWFPVDLDEAAFARMLEVADVELELSRVAFADGRPVAVALVARRGGAGWIGGMGVVSAYRRHGVGRATLVAALDAAARAGIEEMTLEVLEQNVAARTLYELLGFEIVRELEVWQVPAADGDAYRPREVPPGEAHAWLRARRTEREPWQRADGSLAHLEDATGLVVDGAAAVVRVGSGRVAVVQLGGDADALRELLAAARSLGTLSIVNLPAGDPARPALEALGGRVEARQHEMALPLRLPPD
jgi:ribosomal protein S18 acetylase RimI-like enzyme